MDTCLFTGARLDQNTKVEHTIPESLGGRVETRCVASSEFNERWGNQVIAALKAPYAALMNRLGPLLPKAHKSGMIRIDVAGELPGLVLDEDGVVTRDEIQIVARDPTTNRPRSIIGSDERAVRRILRQAGARDDQITLSYVRANTANTYTTQVPIIWADIEFGALIATLLTFDEKLRGRDGRFTRSQEFAPVREFVRSVVENGRLEGGEELNRYSLGLQYEKLPDLLRLRLQSSFPETSFEHVLYASGDAGSRVVDLVWLAFGFDPFAFRISNWRGGDFTYMIVNGILRKTSASELIELPLTGTLCRPTDRRAFPSRYLDESKKEDVMDEVSRRRRAAWEEAVYLVEGTADQFIISNLKLAGDLEGGTSPLSSLVSHRLRRMYGRKFTDSAFETEVKGLVEARLPALDADIATQVYVADSEAEVIDWERWLAFYRCCLRELVVNHGNPGDTYVVTSEMQLDTVGTRRLGEPPVPL